MSLSSTSKQLSYKELQAALRTAKENGLTGIKLNSKQCVLQEEYNRLFPAVLEQESDEYINTELVATAVDNGYCELTSQYVAPPVQAKLNGTIESSCYPFNKNTVKVKNKPVNERSAASDHQLFTTRVIPAMDNKYAPSWLCKPYTVYVIDGVDYLAHELEMQLKGQVCELPAVTNERKLAANLPPRLQTAARKDVVSKARPAVPIINVSKDLPKAALKYSAEPASPYFVDTNHSRFTKTLGITELQAARNLQDAVRATKQGLKNVVSFAKGFHKTQVERALKAA